MKTLVIGRSERMGLGTMTRDFVDCVGCDKCVVIDMQNGRAVDPNVGEVRRLPFRDLESLLKGFDLVVGFETFYDRNLVRTARDLGIRTVLFPMWEWTPECDAEADVLIALSEQDARLYPRAVRMDWMVRPREREPQWPPKKFLHLAGNAMHDRDNTYATLKAASYLEGTGATLTVVCSWPLPENKAVVVPPLPKHTDLYNGFDCLVQPRGLPGHSLPIHEATGAGLPCIVLALQEWGRWPYALQPLNTRPFRARRPTVCHTADPESIGKLMRSMALGEIEYLAGPPLPGYEAFRARWRKLICTKS